VRIPRLKVRDREWPQSDRQSVTEVYIYRLLQQQWFQARFHLTGMVLMAKISAMEKLFYQIGMWVFNLFSGTAIAFRVRAGVHDEGSPEPDLISSSTSKAQRGINI
jgi:hypothetical protein